MTTKLRLCRYPDNGFGEKNNKFYLLDVFGNVFNIKEEYSHNMGEDVVEVEIYGKLYQSDTRQNLINFALADFKITKW